MQMARSEQLHGHADSLSIAELFRHEPGFVFWTAPHLIHILAAST